MNFCLPYCRTASTGSAAANLTGNATGFQPRSSLFSHHTLYSSPALRINGVLPGLRPVHRQEYGRNIQPAAFNLISIVRWKLVVPFFHSGKIRHRVLHGGFSGGDNFLISSLYICNRAGQ